MVTDSLREDAEWPHCPTCETNVMVARRKATDGWRCHACNTDYEDVEMLPPKIEEWGRYEQIRTDGGETPESEDTETDLFEGVEQ